MAPAHTISVPKLSDPAIGELTKLIVEAFDADDLEQLVRIKMNMDYYATVRRESKLNKQVFDLLMEVRKTGHGTLLLSSMLESRPDRDDLRKAIERYCPQALEAPPSPGAQAQSVVTGVETLRRQLKNPDVRSVITASRKKLEQLRKDIDVLFHYKVLHDCLHKIQLNLYPFILDEVHEFCGDPRASAELEDNILELKFICSEAREAAEIFAGRGGRSSTRDAMGGETRIGDYRIE